MISVSDSMFTLSSSNERVHASASSAASPAVAGVGRRDVTELAEQGDRSTSVRSHERCGLGQEGPDRRRRPDRRCLRDRCFERGDVLVELVAERFDLHGPELGLESAAANNGADHVVHHVGGLQLRTDLGDLLDVGE